MEIIRAGWRRDYILGKKSKECIFCNKQAANKEKEHYILFEGKHVFVMMNIYPYNNGHIMISPYRHISCYSEMNKDEILEFALISQKSLQILKTVISPHGFNTGMNIGSVAGAGVEGHVHFHIVPRWAGDTNFMPVLSETKVLSEDLDITYKNLIKHFKKIEDSFGL